jgi:hypothetical protein
MVMRRRFRIGFGAAGLTNEYKRIKAKPSAQINPLRRLLNAEDKGKTIST